MRLSNLEIVKGFSSLFVAPEPIVEIGSFLVAEMPTEAPDFRMFFPGRKYLGVDMRPGPRVDQVEDFEKSTSFDDCSVGTIITCDTLEHVFDTFRFMAEIDRILAPSGLLLLASVMYFPIHSHPFDYWRFTPEAFRRLTTPIGEPLVLTQGPTDFPSTVVAVVRKGGSLTDIEKSMFTDLVVSIPDTDTESRWRHPSHIADSQELCRHLFSDCKKVLFDSRRKRPGVAAYHANTELALRQKGPNLTATSSGNDPHFLLPLLDADGVRELLLKFVIQSGAHSFLQVFFIPIGKDAYCEADSVIEEVRPGYSEIHMRLPRVNPSKRLRIDPLAKAGELTFLSLEVRGR